MQIVFAALPFPRDRRFVMLAAVTLLIHRSHLLFGNRLAIDGGGWLGTFGAVELEDGVGLAWIGAGHDSVLLVITTVHGLRSAHGRLALKPATYSSKLSFREHCPAIWYGTAFRLLTSQLFPGGRGKGRAAVWQTPNSFSLLTQFYFMTLPAGSSCSPSLLSCPFGLALARAETLRPAPAAVLLRALRRALRVSAPPPTLQITRNTGSLQSCLSPRKSTPPGLGAAASRSPGAQAKRAEKE